MEYYIKTICTQTYFFVQQHCLVTVMISSMIHLNERKKITRCFKLRWNWYTQFDSLDSHFNRYFPTFITQVLAEVSYLVVCISWSFHACRICCLRQPWNYHENANGEKMRTLLAGYTFIGFASLCFQTVTSCPLRGLYFITQIYLASKYSQSLTIQRLKITILNSNDMQYNSKIAIDFWRKTSKTIL